MAKGLFGGMTDYSHQSFKDIIQDLESEQRNVTAFLEQIEANFRIVKDNGFWDDHVPSSFKAIVLYCIKHYKTTQEELSDIPQEIQIEVREHHCKRLERIANVADEINMNIGKIWHNQYNNKDYSNDNFRIVESIYDDSRDMAVALLDISNINSRLKDFIGKTEIRMNKNKNISDISNSNFGNNTTIIVGDHGQIKAVNHIKTSNFDDLKELLKRNDVSSEEIEELQSIIENEEPDFENKRLGEKANGWVSKMVNKCLDGTWAIGIGAAGKLLADGIKAYYGILE